MLKVTLVCTPPGVLYNEFPGARCRARYVTRGYSFNLAHPLTPTSHTATVLVAIAHCIETVDLTGVITCMNLQTYVIRHIVGTTDAYY